MARLGLIGLGYWGNIYIRTFKKMGIEFDACTHEYENFLLKDSNINGVIIATPVETHAEIITRSLFYKKHVLVEKPFTTKSSDAVDILKLPYNNVLMVGHLYLYHPAIIKIKELLKTMGPIKWIDIRRLGGKSEKNSLWELGSHDLYILNYLIDQDPIKIKNKGNKRKQKTKIIYPDFKVNLETSTKCKNKTREIIIGTDKGLIIFDDTSEKKLMIGTKNRIEFIELDETTSPLENQINHFLDCIKNKSTPFSDGFAGLKNVETLEKITSS